LKDLVEQVKRLKIKSIAIPPLGCGNGGLEWSDVRPLIVDAFEQIRDVEVRLFEPIGAPAAKAMEVHTPKPKMTPGRAAILKVLDTYRALGYGLSKIEVQKLAYFLQEAGQGLKLTFVPHEYGPYSDQLRHVLNKIYWVAQNKPFAQSHTEALQAIHGWNERKRQLMQPAHVEIAWNRLVDEGWISVSSRKAAANN
jgi:hypothetical protein